MGLCPGGDGEVQSLGVCGSACLCEWGEDVPVGSFAEGGGVLGVQAGGGEDAFAGLVCCGEPCSDEPSWLCCWACFSALRHFARLFWNQTCKDVGATS